jgi:hypothetical protein
MPDAKRFASGVRAQLDGCDKFAAAMTGAHCAATSTWNRRRQPTLAQQMAGNYAKGTIGWHGLTLRIENPAHTVREGTDPDGRSWRNVMAAHYGEILGTVGADGDAVDIFIGPFPESPQAWVLNQRDHLGGFDEHKVLVGFPDAEAAVSAYRASYSPGWDRYGEPIPMTATQLKRWLKSGDTTIELTPDAVPAENDMPNSTNLGRVFWDSAAMPASGRTLASVLYEIRLDDAADGLTLDAMTMADVVEGQELVVLDALVTIAGRLQPKMLSLQRIMEAAAGEVKPVAMQISEPMRRFGGAHVAVIYELSDGQTITVWFHNPDSTPNMLSPADELVSWKWQLNKKDITIVVAPESGSDLNLREVARRIMRLAEKNSAAFAKANAKRAETMAELTALKGKLAERQEVLRGLLVQVEAERAAVADRAALAANPLWKRGNFDPTTAANYALIHAAGEEALLYWQDELDDMFSRRIVAVRNALRALGWEAEVGAPMGKGNYFAVTSMTHIGSGRNVVAVSWEIMGVTGFFMSDDLSRTPEELAAGIDLGLISFLAQKSAQEAAAAAVQPDPQPAAQPEPQVVPAPVVDEPIVEPAPAAAAANVPEPDGFADWIAEVKHVLVDLGKTEDEATAMIAAADANDLKNKAASSYEPTTAVYVLWGLDVPGYLLAKQQAEEAAAAAAVESAKQAAEAEAARVQAEADAAAAAQAAAALEAPTVVEVPAVAEPEPSVVPPVAVESAETQFLREVSAGAHDALEAADLLDKIEATVAKLQADGLLAGDIDTLAGQAIDHWAELEAAEA